MTVVDGRVTRFFVASSDWVSSNSFTFVPDYADRGERSVGFDHEHSRGGFSVTLAVGPRGNQDVLSADVFSWSELPELLAAEALFDGMSDLPRFADASIVAASDEDEDEDEDENEDLEDEDDEEYEDEEEEEGEDDEDDDFEDDDDEWEEVEDDEEEEEEEEDGEEEEDEDWEDDDEEWEDEDEEEEDDED
jgi:hypothetical protein